MKILGFFMAVFGFVFLANLAYAEDITIEMLNKRDDGAKMVYSEDIARINVGDTITWVPTSKDTMYILLQVQKVGNYLRNQKTTKKLQLHLTHQAFICTSVHHTPQWV